MVRDIDLLRYLPLFIQEYREIRKIMETENPEFRVIAKLYERLENNQFIVSCDETGIARFEQILGIVPTADDTLESRISRVLIRWNDTVPYTWKAFLNKIYTLCGNDFEVRPDWNNYKLKIITHLEMYGQSAELDNLLTYMIPANIAVNAENSLNYQVNGNLFIGTGCAFISRYDLTDSYKVSWSFDNPVGSAVTNSGTCEIMITDSYNGEIDVQADSADFTTIEMVEQIETTDTDNKNISIESTANNAGAIGYTDIIER